MNATHRSRRRRLFTGLIVLLIAGGSVAAWDELLKYRFVAKRFGEVVPGLVFRSGQISRWMIGEVLDRHGIRVVIDLQAKDVSDEHQQSEITAVDERSLDLHRLPLDGDGRGEVDTLVQAIELMHCCRQAGQPVLIHCGAGAHRTGAVISLYRMLVEGWTADAAFAEICDYGWSRGNTKMIAFLNEQAGPIAKALQERGVIEAVPQPLPVLSID